MCGIVGIFGHHEASTVAYLSLYALQHRGQESAGIVTCEAGELIRRAGTEPKIRLYAEGRSAEEMRNLMHQARRMFTDRRK